MILQNEYFYISITGGSCAGLRLFPCLHKSLEPCNDDGGDVTRFGAVPAPASPVKSAETIAPDLFPALCATARSLASIPGPRR